MHTTVVIIGAGQAGLAMSHCLTTMSLDHVVVERGEVAQSWRSERWDSLRLLTPNWLSRLPGYRYRGADPDGYMTAAEVIAFFEGYRASFSPPVVSGTTVSAIRPALDGWSVRTDAGEWRCRAVVMATGACSTPRLPAVADQLPATVRQLAPIHYRNPDQLEEGGVLVVGASASGAQIAEELVRAGRPVTLAVGEHMQLSRTYRGRDIHWWMDAIGQLDERWDETEELARARRLPSLQLVGSPERRDIGLNALAAQGVRLAGRLAGVSGSKAQFSGSLANMCALADLKQLRLLDRIDAWAQEAGLDADLPAPSRPERTTVPTPPVNVVDLTAERIGTVVWATGFRPHFPWLPDDLKDRKGYPRHDGGVLEAPGLYVMGLPFTRRRKSSFIDGVGPDAQDLSQHLAAFLDRSSSPQVVAA